MKILFKLLMGLAVLLVVFLIVGMMLPERLQVERSIVIRADASKVYPYISNFRLFNQWSPWAKIDPDVKHTYEGPEQGQGAIMHWRSEHTEVGKGSQKIVEAEPNRHIKIVLAFGGMGKAYANYNLQADQESTTVTWAFDMRFGYNIPGRIMGLFIGDQIGASYDKGLVDLKRLVEQQ